MKRIRLQEFLDSGIHITTVHWRSDPNGTRTLLGGRYRVEVDTRDPLCKVSFFEREGRWDGQIGHSERYIREKYDGTNFRPETISFYLVLAKKSGEDRYQVKVAAAPEESERVLLPQRV